MTIRGPGAGITVSASASPSATEQPAHRPRDRTHRASTALTRRSLAAVPRPDTAAAAVPAPRSPARRRGALVDYVGMLAGAGLLARELKGILVVEGRLAGLPRHVARPVLGHDARAADGAGVVLAQPGLCAGRVEPVAARQREHSLAQRHGVHADGALGRAAVAQRGGVDGPPRQRGDGRRRGRARRAAARVLLHELRHDAVKGFLRVDGVAAHGVCRVEQTVEEGGEGVLWVSVGGASIVVAEVAAAKHCAEDSVIRVRAGRSTFGKSCSLIDVDRHALRVTRSATAIAAATATSSGCAEVKAGARTDERYARTLRPGRKGRDATGLHRRSCGLRSVEITEWGLKGRLSFLTPSALMW